MFCVMEEKIIKNKLGLIKLAQTPGNVSHAAWLDSDKQLEIYKPLIPYILKESYYLSLPVGMLYQFWQPWIKNYQDEYEVGYMACFFNWSYYIWIDQDLKEEMTGMR